MSDMWGVGESSVWDCPINKNIRVLRNGLICIFSDRVFLKRISWGTFSRAIQRNRDKDEEKKLSVYLDTSVISALFDERNPKRKSLTETFFKEGEKFDIFVSKSPLLKSSGVSFPEGYPEDAYHVAVAVINEVGYLLSWNFKHIVRRKKREIVRMVNPLNNLR